MHWLLTLNKLPLQYVHFSVGYFCHILYVFSLNSTVCSHVVEVYLSSDQVTYDFMVDANLYNSLLLRLRNKSHAYELITRGFELLTCGF